MPQLQDFPSIQSCIQTLRGMTQRDVMSQWRVCQADLDLTEALDSKTWQDWAIATPNERNHVAWAKGELHLWLGQIITIPTALDRYPLQGLELRLDLTWWAILSETYVNGQLVQEGDLFDCFGRVLLSDKAQPGDTIEVAIHLISPGHDPGALVKSLLWFEPRDVAQPDPGMVADELEVVQGYLNQFRSGDMPKLEAIASQVNWSHCHDPEGFHGELTQLRSQLGQWQDWLQQRKIYWTGHAHLDMAWLWPVSETWEVAERTFASALDLMDDFPELRFCHSSPALYDWIERHRPEQFARIQDKVDQGQWEVAAGLWIEPEFNLSSGESLVRQVLYGQLYTQEKFGRLSATAWLPDSFGFCWQLPQILKQGGIDYFVTQKLRWNDSTEFPHEVFKWRSPDGTELYSVMLPPIGTRIEPVKMTEFAQTWEQKTGNDLSYWLPGIGDHGGGPTRDMLEVARRWESSDLIPPLESRTAEEFCRQTEAKLPSPSVWNDELYLEYHRGCYTSRADQKLYNRQCEAILTEAELWSSIATILTQASYPKDELEQAWKKVLFNQFHDILPGSSIPQVFVDANQYWEAARSTGLALRAKAMTAIATHISKADSARGKAILVFNSLNWQRSGWIEVEVDASQDNYQVLTDDGQIVPSYRNHQGHLYVWVEDVPSVGYQRFWLQPGEASQTISIPESWRLENEMLRVTIDPSTGAIAELFDKRNQRSVLTGLGNQLQFFRDQGQYWDAWNIDPEYAKYPLENAQVKAIEWVCPVEQRIRVTLTFEESTFIQDYILRPQTPYLQVSTQVDWQTDHVLVKASFPLSVAAETVTCDMPCGVIERPTLPNPKPLEDWQKAKWEIPAIHWADLTDDAGDYGVSLLNDCKYGYDAQPSQLRLTLLRGSVWPDPECDRGHHQFSYGIYPHQGSWKEARTTQLGYEFNRPLQVQSLDSAAMSGDLPPQQSCLSLPEDVMLMALKQSEHHGDRWVLRCYEAVGDRQALNINVPANLNLTHRLNGLEQEIGKPNNHIQPWQIVGLGFSGCEP